MLSGYVSVLSGRHFVPWRGGGRLGACQGPPGPRPVQAPRALTPLVARSTSVCRRLRSLHPSVPPAPTAPQGPARSYDISMDTIVLAPTVSVINRPPAALRTSCWVARLSPSGSSCRRAAAATSLRLPLLLGTSCVRLAISASRPGQSAKAVVFMSGLDASCVGTTSSGRRFPPSSRSPKVSFRLPATSARPTLRRHQPRRRPDAPFHRRNVIPLVFPHCLQVNHRPTSLPLPSVPCLPRPTALPAWHSSAHSASEYQTLP